MTCRVADPPAYESGWHLLHRWSNWVVGLNYQQRVCVRCRKVERKAVER